MVTNKTNGHTKQIENQIIHIKATQQGKQLQHFNQEHDPKAGAEKTKINAQLWIYSRQKYTDGNKQEDISAQVDDAVHQCLLVASVADNLPIIADGKEGLQVDVLP